MDNACIVFDSVSFYGDNLDIKILSDLTLSIPADKVTCLLGASGSGKSTILRLIAGLETPYEGTIRLRNQVVSKDNHIVIKAEKRKLALMFQDYALIPFISVLDNVLFAIKLSKTPQDIQRACDILDDLGLFIHKDKHPHQLSGGEQQRLALARAIMQNTDIVMLDEPFSNLDSELRRRLREETLAVLKNHNKTILMVTHDPTEAFLSADNVIYLRDGHIIQSGSPEEIYLNPQNLDIALFSGAMNILSGVIHAGFAQTQMGVFPVTTLLDGKVTIAIRHEGFVITPYDSAMIHAVIIKKEFAGRFYRLTLEYNACIFIAELTDYSVSLLKIGDILALSVRSDAIFVFA
jgi:iron(III) transport system ATP-binding protein